MVQYPNSSVAKTLGVVVGLETVVELEDVRAVLVGDLAGLVAEVLAHLGEERRSVDQLDVADPLGLLGVVEDPHVGGDAGVEEHVGRQRDDGIDQVGLQQPPPDLGLTGLGGPVEERGAVEDDRGPATALGDRTHLRGEVGQEQHLPVADLRQPRVEPAGRAHRSAARP